MLYAIISDIHANLEALEVALTKIKKFNCDRIICLGDIIGYGPNPNECLDLVFENADRIVRGNHEDALINTYLRNDMSYNAGTAINFTERILDARHFEKVTNLELFIEEENILFTHSNPTRFTSWDYIFSKEDAEEHLEKMKTSLCFLGHTHKADIFSVNESNEISKNSKAIINVGSVGQPRDLDNRLSIGIFDSDKWIYKNYRYKYNYEKTADKILKAGLPGFLANRLFIGM